MRGSHTNKNRMPNITARKHITNTRAGVGFCWRTGRYVVLSHAAAAAPDNFHVPSRSRLGEKRTNSFPEPGCSIR
jgi:hypothetical protein